MSTNQPQYIEKLRQTVQTGTLSRFLFSLTVQSIPVN